jgi:hypothetical protein
MPLRGMPPYGIKGRTYAVCAWQRLRHGAGLAECALGAGDEDEYLLTYQLEYFGGFKCGDIFVDA